MNEDVGQFVLLLDPPLDPGLYHYDVDATGDVVASRSGTFTVLDNVAVPTEVGWAVAGPCSPWTDANDAWLACGSPTTTLGDGSSAVECAVDMTSFARMASEVLYELSGRLFAGQCEKTVRPCGVAQCGFQVLSRGYVVWQDGWPQSWWTGRNWYGGCGCQPLSRVLLSGYPVREIVEVKIDGDVVDPTTYRLDERRYLTRVRASDSDEQLFWPSCQMMDLADDQAGTFSVTYRYGQDPPLVGQQAAARLACEFYKLGSGAECAIPAGTTRVARTGLTVDKNATLAWFYGKNGEKGWQTGLGVVDAFLSAYASSGLKRRPSVWSPTGPQYARPVGGTFGS